MLAGLKPALTEEVGRVLGRVTLHADDDPTALRFTYSGPLSRLLRLRTAVAAYLLVSVPGRRPSTLLGDSTLFDQVELVRGLHPPGSFGSFRLSAPGKQSAALRRLREELSRRTGLADDPDDGELLLRIRRSPGTMDGWDLLTRLSPRPLSTRRWRVHHLPGALNATIAAAMVDMSRPRRADRVLNLMCGSGTLLVERFARGRPALAVGCDLDPAALAGARRNLESAGLAGAVALARMDATALGVADGRVDVLLADLPYATPHGLPPGQPRAVPGGAAGSRPRGGTRSGHAAGDPRAAPVPALPARRAPLVVGAAGRAGLPEGPSPDDLPAPTQLIIGSARGLTSTSKPRWDQRSSTRPP